ncbi:MAG: acyltransferase [Flavobacteriia bacterium]
MSLKNKISKKISVLLNLLSKPVMFQGKSLPFEKDIKDTRISSTTFIDYPQNLKIGENVFVGQFNFIEASNEISIGEGCQITNYVTMTTHSSHDAIRIYGSNYRQEKEFKVYQRGSIHIGNYSYIGPYSLITPGTTIGKGCIVHSYSLLKGDYPDFSIIKGNPGIVVGDTRERDEAILAEYPELRKFHFMNTEK